MRGRLGQISFISLVATVGLCWLLSAAASAVVLKLPNGQLAGVAPHRGVDLSSSPAAVAARRGVRAPRLSSSGSLDYNGGPVLHSSTPYLIFWDPSGTEISSASRALLTRYFTDYAADSGLATNVYSVNRQFTDGSGFADNKKTFSAGSQAISDTQAYPTTGRCAHTATTYPVCLTDAQLQAEISRLRTANSLPGGIGPNAPIYFVVLPSTVNTCFDNTSNACADTQFCAYHSPFSDGGTTVLYSDIPMFFNGASSAQNPKNCQFDGNSAPQKPNGDAADVAIKYLSHEDNETITDPTITAWFDAANGNEDGDNCNFFGGTVDPKNGSNPNAFTPTLGGSASSGTLFNQLVNGNHYYIQSEWSNGDSNCRMQPSAGALAPAFTATSGQAVTFDPSGSTSTRGFTSETWSFGDGGTAFSLTGSPTSVSHTYAAPGTYPVTLTLVDTAGNLSTVAHNIVTTASQPTATITTPSNGAVFIQGQVVNASYSCQEGTGGPGIQSCTGPVPSGSPIDTAALGQHSFKATATSADAQVASTTSTYTVVAPGPGPGRPSATIATPANGASFGRGQVVKANFSCSPGPNGGVLKTGTAGCSGTVAGGQPIDTSSIGMHTFRVTATDADGQTTTVTSTYRVDPPTIAKVRKKKNNTKRSVVVRVAVNAPGALHANSKSKRLKNPGTAQFTFTLSGKERATLAKNGVLTIKVRIKFVPNLGGTSKRTVKVTFTS